MCWAKVGLKNDVGEVFLFLAIDLEDFYFLQELISWGVDVNCKLNGIIFIVKVIELNNVWMVVFLVCNGGDFS